MFQSCSNEQKLSHRAFLSLLGIHICLNLNIINEKKYTMLIMLIKNYGKNGKQNYLE